MLNVAVSSVWPRAGTALSALGGLYVLSDELTHEAQAQTRADGKPRLPPGQRVLKAWKPMGGEPGDPSLERFRLRVHGEVEAPFALSYAELLALPQVARAVDVHCVTGWSVMGANVRGVLLSELAARAKVKPSARHVVFEGAHGYTSNVPLREALGPDVMVARELEGAALPRTHGGPLRAIVPHFGALPKIHRTPMSLQPLRSSPSLVGAARASAHAATPGDANP